MFLSFYYLLLGKKLLEIASSSPSRIKKVDHPSFILVGNDCFPFSAETECAEDMVSTTTIVPTTPKQTTSQVPTTSPSPTSSPPNPAVGKYSVTGPNGTCILAYMGLQLNITYPKKDEKVHFDFCFFKAFKFLLWGRFGNLL